MGEELDSREHVDTTRTPPGRGVDQKLQVVVGGQFSNLLEVFDYDPPAITSVLLSGTTNFPTQGFVSLSMSRQL